MTGVMKTGGVYIMRIFTPELLGARIHACNESIDAAADRFGEDVARFVGGHDQHTVEKLLDRQRFTDLDIGGAAVTGKTAERRFARRQGVGEGKPAAVDRFKHQQRRHELGDGGGIVFLMRVLLKQNLAGGGFNEKSCPGVKVKLLERARLRRQKQGEQQRKQQKKR